MQMVGQRTKPVFKSPVAAILGRLAALFVLLLASTLAAAAEQKKLPSVNVVSMRNPVDKSYRKMVAGMDLFEEYHHLAPRASLRFRFLPRERDIELQTIVLKVVGNSFSTLVPLAADNSFTIVRNPVADAEDASVMPNRRADSMTWRAQVRTPGLAENQRRLGDLRLECLVGVRSTLLTNYSHYRSTADIDENATRALTLCLDKSSQGEYLLFAERPLFSVTLRDGDRTEVLPFNQLYAGGSQWRGFSFANCDCRMLIDKTYNAPLRDKSWSDNTLIEFDYMDGNAAPASQAGAEPIPGLEVGKTRIADLTARFGEAYVLNFDNQYQVAVYVFETRTPQTNKLEGQTELTLLFGPDGLLRKWRTRETSTPIAKKM